MRNLLTKFYCFLKKFRFFRKPIFYMFSICLLFFHSCDADGNTAAVTVTKMLPQIETGIPFVGVLLSIALGPLLMPRLWHKYENIILGIWVVLSTWLCFISIGVTNTENLITYVIVREYIPFIILIGTLFTVSNGIKVDINRKGTTKINVFIFIIGEFLANFIGTTGTAILLLKPLLKVNKLRKYKVHTIICFIFLVSNIGGCLLPLGDPPLFLGYLKGIDFSWTLKKMFPMFFILSSVLIFLYSVIDYFLLKKEKKYNNSFFESSDKIGVPVIQLSGFFCIFLMLLVVVIVAGTGVLPKKTLFSVFGVSVHSRSLLRDVLLIILSFVSFLYSKRRLASKKEKVSWEPLNEVVRCFIAIFITMAPVAAMLRGGHEFFSPIKSALDGSSHPAFLYFWLVSPFSAFLDNAPTYLIFFKMVGGNAQELMNEGAKILMAISSSSVFMGAMTYIGNAPNFMIRSIAKQNGVNMPSFLGYSMWACLILLPLFAIISLIFLY